MAHDELHPATIAVSAGRGEARPGDPLNVALCSGTRAFLDDRVASGRLRVRYVDIAGTSRTLAACAGAQLLWVESPTNRLLAVADLPALVAGAHEEGMPVAVDNTFATPPLQQPLHVGATSSRTAPRSTSRGTLTCCWAR